MDPKDQLTRPPQVSSRETPEELKWLLQVTRQEGFQAALFLEQSIISGPGLGGGVRWPQRHVHYVNCRGQSSFTDHPGHLSAARAACGPGAAVLDPVDLEHSPSFQKFHWMGPLPVAPPPPVWFTVCTQHWAPGPVSARGRPVGGSGQACVARGPSRSEAVSGSSRLPSRLLPEVSCALSNCPAPVLARNHRG